MSFREEIYERLQGRPYPLFISSEHVISAASLWAYVRQWTLFFRENGLSEGGCLYTEYTGAVFPAILIAALRERLNLFIGRKDSFLGLSDKIRPVHISDIHIGSDLLPSGEADFSGKFGFLETEGIWLLTSGSAGFPRWINLTEKNIFTVIVSHMNRMNIQEGEKILSVLPWSHVFGLVIDLMIGLFCGAEIFRIPGLKSPEAISETILRETIHHFHCVPLTAEKMIETEKGREALLFLRGGVIGGAPVSRRTAEFLKRTKLRVGYGQTEASPGIMLGESGEWEEFFIGRPVGCKIILNNENVLHFSGENAYAASLSEDGTVEKRREDSVNTGDRVMQEGDRFYFRGRMHSNFKLNNGLFVEAALLESRLRENADSNVFMIFTEDYENIQIVSQRFSEEDSKLIREILGNLLPRLETVYVLDASLWEFNPKGEILRKKILEKLKTAGEEKCRKMKYSNHLNFS